jgi:hypothetical protein
VVSTGGRKRTTRAIYVVELYVQVSVKSLMASKRRSNTPWPSVARFLLAFSYENLFNTA